MTPNEGWSLVISGLGFLLVVLSRYIHLSNQAVGKVRGYNRQCRRVVTFFDANEWEQFFQIS